MNVERTAADAIFVQEEDWAIHAYRIDGSVLPGWPASSGQLGDPERHTAAIADLDGDGDPEIISVSGQTHGADYTVYLLAYHHDGSPVAGFPVSFIGFVDTFPVVGDVDGDGQVEIIVVAQVYPTPHRVRIYRPNGTLKRTIALAGFIPYGSAPALADLDGDGRPEIIVQTDTTLEVFYGDGRRFPGWPVRWTDTWMGNSGPVVGDVDGDRAQEIVVTTTPMGSSQIGLLRAYNTDGTNVPHFPKTLNLGFGAVPAIADLDRDGRNEIVACGDFWDGVRGYSDKCWAFDLKGTNYGRIEWGQFGGNAAHLGVYPVPVIVGR
jgi:hypothetical protein